MIGYLCGGMISVKKSRELMNSIMTSDEASEESEFFKCFSSDFCSQKSQRRTNRMHSYNRMPWERCFGGATDGIRKEHYMYITVFVDTRLSKTKRPRKRFQHFRQSYMLSTDRIEIHQSQPASMTQRRSEGHTNGCDRWISIRSVDNTQDFRQFCLIFRRWHRRHLL